MTWTHNPKNKYGNRKTVVDGVTFASKKEALRYSELRLLEKAGKIRYLRLQPHFDFVHNGVKICRYVADFEYMDVELNRQITEDVKVKATATLVFNIKRKMMLAFYGIEVKLI